MGERETRSVKGGKEECDDGGDSRNDGIRRKEPEREREGETMVRKKGKHL